MRRHSCAAVNGILCASVAVGGLTCAWVTPALAAPGASSEGEGVGVNAPKPAEAAFTVQEYRVLGNTVMPVRDIERLLYPMLGPNKRLQDVEAARTALEKAYHDHGFGTVFVDIPPQEVSDGIVRLRVTEAKLNQRKIDGANYFSERAIVAALPAAQVGGVPSLTALQQQLAGVNSQTADRSVVPILKAGPAPGTVDLELKVSDRLPLHGSVTLDDNYTAFTKPLRATVSLSYANVFGELDQISLQYQAAPQQPGQVGVFNAGYTSRPLGDGYRLSGFFIDSNSDVANVGIGSTGVLGKGQIVGLRLSTPPFTSTHSSQVLTLGLDYKHFRDTVTTGGGSAALVTPISYTNASISYSGFWQFKLLDESLNITPNFGLRDAPNSAADFENKRYLGRPNYAYVRWDNSVILHLPAQYRLTLRLAGQVTNEPLISNENYSIAGADSVRGYLEAEELGDVAFKGTLQLQSPVWSWHVQQLVSAFAFFDAGHTHTFATLGEQLEHAELASWGLGVNFMPSGSVGGVLMWADPLSNGTYTTAHQSRVLFSVHGSF
jgi:hemolysin activation/secretion protein